MLMFSYIFIQVKENIVTQPAYIGEEIQRYVRCPLICTGQV